MLRFYLGLKVLTEKALSMSTKSNTGVSYYFQHGTRNLADLGFLLLFLWYWSLNSGPYIC
jgi:hypothetical protein